MTNRPFVVALILLGLAVALPLTLPAIAAAADDTRQPFGDKPHVIPGKIEAEDYDRGRAGVAYQDVDQKNEGADYRGPTGVDIEKRDDASGGHGIGWTKPGEWVSYSVVVKEPGTYSVKFPVASNRQGGTFHLEIDGKDVSGEIEIPDTGSWQTLKTITAKGIQLQAGKFVLKMVMDDAGKSGFIGDIDYLLFEKTSR